MRYKKRKIYVIAFAAVGIVVVALFAFNYWRARSLHYVGAQAMRAVLSNDADALFRFIEPTSAEVTNVTPETLQRLMDTCLAGKLEGFEPESASNHVAFETDQQLMITRDLSHPDGRHVEIAVSAQRVDAGGRVKVVGVVRGLVLFGIMADLPAGTPMPNGLAKVEFFASGMEGLIPKLEDSGIKGLAKREQDGEQLLVAVTWKDHVKRRFAYIEDQYALLEEQKR